MKLVKDVVEKVKKDIPDVPSAYLDVTSRNLTELPANLHGEPVKRLFMVIPSKGCEWGLEEGGNCIPCGALYYTSQTKDIPKEVVFGKWKQVYDTVNWDKYPVLSLCTGGSFLSEKEVPKDVKEDILKIIDTNKGIKKVIIESLPHLVTSESIKELKSLLRSKEIEVGVGLECYDDWIRINCVNKNFSREEYEKASKVIKDNGLLLLTYVHIKPPFLTEKESIDEAVRTVNYAFQTGADAISLEPIIVMKYTLADLLHKKGRFKPAWLWSVLDVLEKTYDPSREIRINLNENFETTEGQPKNYCTKDCSSVIRNKILEYDQTLNRDVFNGINCECKSKWEKECRETSPYSLEERIKLYLS